MPSITPVLIPRLTRAVAIALVLTGATAAHADLLVYEGFNGYTPGTLAGQTPNANTIGLDQTVGYYDGAATSRTGGYTLTTGLSLGSLPVSGGALAFTSGTNVIGADLDLDSSFTGTLWSSYLVKLSSRGSVTGDGAVIRIGTKPSDSGGAHFNSWADARTSTTASTNTSIGYGTATPATANGNASLALNTTYIIVNRFTNVGNVSGGTATLWAFTEAQFAAFSGQEGDIDSAVVTSTASNTVTGSFVFSSTQAFGIVTVADVGVYDELRFGSTLADVIPTAIPEPASMAFWMGLAAAASLVPRRRRA